MIGAQDGTDALTAPVSPAARCADVDGAIVGAGDVAMRERAPDATAGDPGGCGHQEAQHDRRRKRPYGRECRRGHNPRCAVGPRRRVRSLLRSAITTSRISTASINHITPDMT